MYICEGTYYRLIVLTFKRRISVRTENTFRLHGYKNLVSSRSHVLSCNILFSNQSKKKKNPVSYPFWAPFLAPLSRQRARNLPVGV